MTANKMNIDRDEVLFAFHEKCERPTARDIIEWTCRYPEFAEDIRAHAAVRLDRAPGAPETDIAPDETLLARGRSRALNAIYTAAREADDSAAAPLSWDQALSARNLNVPQLARELDIDRSVLAELAAGRMRPPVGSRLSRALTQALGVTQAWLDVTVSSLAASPRLGHAKADGPPTVFARTYEEIIRASSMSEERQRYWLEEM